MVGGNDILLAKKTLRNTLKPQSLRRMGVSELGNYLSYNPFRSWYARRRLYVILEMTKLCSSKCNALDFGCGAGYFLPPLALIFSTVYGLELKSEWNEKLKSRVEKYFYEEGHTNISYNLVEEGNEFSKFENRSIDFISAADILEHFTDVQISNFIGETSRILKENAILVVSLPTENWIYNMFSSSDSGHIANSSKKINDIISQLSKTFHPIECQYLFPFFKVVCYRKIMHK